MKLYHLKKPNLFIIKSLFFFFISVFIFSGCSKFGDISVKNKNFDDEVQLSQNLSFTFSKDFSVPDLNEWVSTEFLKITPEVKGRFKWVAPNELVFSPNASFNPATEYTVELNRKALQSISKDKNASISTEEIEFHTPYLKLEGAESYWIKSRQDGNITARIKLKFNYPVNGRELANLLKINQKDAPVAFNVTQTGINSNIAVEIKGADKFTSDNLNILLDKGLSIANFNYKTKEEISLQTALPDLKTLEILDVQHGFENNTGFIKVITNQQLNPELPQGFFKIEVENKDKKEEETNENNVQIQYDSLGNPVQVKVAANPKEDKHHSQISTKVEFTENGVIFWGDFNETDNYILTLSTKTGSALGVSLESDFVKDVYFGEMPPTISFLNKKAIYLSSKGNKNIGLNIVNVPKVNVKISKIYANNILQFMRNNRYQDYNYSSDGLEATQAKTYTYYDDDSGLLSDVIVQKTIETGNLPKTHGISAMNLSLPDQNNLKGIYLVTVNSNDEYYLNASKLVSISDIGLIVKQSADELVVFANSIKTTEAMSGVEIQMISSNNQTIQTLKTDSKGLVIFKDLKKNSGGFKVGMITANIDEDFNYLLLEDTAVETSRFEVEGLRDNNSGFQAFIYGDRDIYRPGETVHFNTIVRTQNWESVGKIPVKIRLLMPNGREFRTFLKETNEQGAVELSIPTETSIPTGTFVFEILNGNDVLLASRNISIEEFMPDRIKVDLKSDKESYRNGEQIGISATALNLFGPPASNRNYEMEFKLARKLFQPKGFGNYRFDIQDNTNFETVVRQGVTNDQGIAAEKFQIPLTYSDMGMLESKTYVTVFDETGRPVNRLKRLDIFTQPVFYGIGMPDTYVGTNVPVQIPLVALNQMGKPVNAKGKIEIIRFDYQTVIEKNTDNSLKYSSKKQTKIVYSRTVDFVNGKASISYAPPVSGEYELRIHREGARSWTAQEFYAYGWGNTENSSFEVNNEGQVTMEFNKDKYEVGDKAKVLFKTPFAGKLLVTIERNHVMEYHYLQTDKKSAELTFKIGNEHLPNVYVSATLIRPMDDSNLPLTVAHGYAPVMVENPENQLPVSIVAVEKSRSKTKQRITVRAKANTEITVAVVDEGILQLKNFKTPDPYAYFYQKKALEVDNYDLYPFLFPELSISSHSSIGGDGYDLEKRVNPLTNGRVNLVAFWSGVLKTNSKGEVDYEFDIPQFSGDLRIMAVAYKDEALGSANVNMKVADPLVISSALPRFASPNDELVVPVNITNTTKQAAAITATISTTGGLAIVGGNTQKINIAPEKEGRVNFMVKAAAVSGNGKVVVKVNGLKENFSDITELTIRPGTSLLKISNSGSVNGGQNATVSLQNDFIPSTIKSQLLISRSPMTQFIDKFEDLLGYPHGCVEQTVSKAFPQLYFSDFVKQIQKGKKPYLKSGENELNPKYNVEAAINKLESMQLPNGALSYWQGNSTESWWGTAYALHFLIEAQRADYQTNTGIVGKMIDYLNSKVSKQEMEEEYYWDAGGVAQKRQIVKRETIYSLYTLALAGKPNRSIMNYYKSNLPLLTEDEKYLLAAAFNLTGDVKSYSEILPKNLGSDRSQKATGGSFSSPIRNAALSLNTLIEVDKDNLQIPTLARLLSQAVKTERWLSTQEQAFTFLALGKLARKANASQTTAIVSANGKTIGNFTGTDLLLKNVGNQTQINVQNKGNLYYFAQMEGLSSGGKVQEIDNVLKVRRQYYDRAGQILNGNTFKQNQLVVVKITLQSSNSLPVENIVVTDMLPAGFEIENPRLTADRDFIWIKDQASPEYFDIRDDRINFFTSLKASNKAQNFYYLVRVVSKGRFNRGVLSADAMYNGEYRSYNGAGIVSVE